MLYLTAKLLCPQPAYSYLQEKIYKITAKNLIQWPLYQFCVVTALVLSMTIDIGLPRFNTMAIVSKLLP